MCFYKLSRSNVLAIDKYHKGLGMGKGLRCKVMK